MQEINCTENFNFKVFIFKFICACIRELYVCNEVEEFIVKIVSQSELSLLGRTFSIESIEPIVRSRVETIKML